MGIDKLNKDCKVQFSYCIFFDSSYNIVMIPQLFVLLLVGRITCQNVLPVITCSQLPQDLDGIWICDPPVQPGHGYHIGTQCIFYCDNIAVGIAMCNDLGRWKPDDPNDRPDLFTCHHQSSIGTTGHSTITSTSTIEVSSTSSTPSTSTSTTSSSSSTTSFEICSFPLLELKVTSLDTRSMFCPRDVCPAVYIIS